MTDPMAPPAPPAKAAARAEWAAAIALAALSIVWWVLASRETWFFADSWDFLARRQIGDVASWLEPHLGHLQIPTFLLHRALYGAVGLDYFPWYVIPHATIYALVALLVWRSARWRGASRAVAFAVYTVFLTLGVAEVVYATVIGPLVALAGMAVIAAWLDGTRVPARFPRLWLAVVVTLMVASGSTATIVAGAALLVVVATPRLRSWWPSFVVPAGLYVAWWLTWAGDTRMNDADFSALSTMPVDAVRMLGVALGRLFGVPEAGWPVYAGALAAAVAVLAVRGRLTPSVRLTLVALGGLLVAILLIRVTDDDLLRATRYSFVLTTVAIVGLGPAVRLPRDLRRPAAAALVVLVGWMVVSNGAFRMDRIGRRAEQTQAARIGVDAVATMAAEPMVGGIRVDRLGDFPYMSVTVASVVRFVEEGYRPLPVDEALLDQLRPGLRFAVSSRGRPEGEPLALPGAGDGGCLVLRPGEPAAGAAVAAGTIRLRPRAPTPVVLRWADRFGAVERRVDAGDLLLVEVPDPGPGGAVVTIEAVQERVGLCGVRPAP